MAIPGIPQNLTVQQGNAQVLVDWSTQVGASSYEVSRSEDNITFAVISTVSVPMYLDLSVVVGTTYYYRVRSQNLDGLSAYSSVQSVVPTESGDDSLGSIRLQAQQRADRVGSNFVSRSEWNTYINKSSFELYDLLVTLYEDYYIADPYEFTFDGSTDRVTLPKDFYKCLGIDVSQGNQWITIKKFNFMARNEYQYQSITSRNFVDLKYRVMGNEIRFNPKPQGNQGGRVWYVPRMKTLLKDSDILEGVSGWSEYVIVDSAIKALQKEESDISALLLQKNALIKRIEDSAMNRDAGEPDTISDVRNRNGNFNDGWWE